MVILQQHQENQQEWKMVLKYLYHYLVALSPRYGKIGDTVKITLDTGVQLNVTIADFKKQDETKLGWGMHKISNNQNCLLEFIVDSNKVSKKILKTGDFSRIYPGQIVKIENSNM